MRGPVCRCAGASQRAPRWRPSKICSGSPRAERDWRSQTVLWATQRRRACAAAPGSGCGRGLGSLKRRGPGTVAVLAAGCPPHPAAAADHPRIPGGSADFDKRQITGILTLGHPKSGSELGECFNKCVYSQTNTKAPIARRFSPLTEDPTKNAQLQQRRSPALELR